MDPKKANILTKNINKIVQQFELTPQFWSELEKSEIFPSEYTDFMKKEDTDDEENKKKNIIIDLKRRNSLCYEKFSNILRTLCKSDILYQYLQCHEKDAYPIVSEVPGTCLIINNKEFVRCELREGSENDVEMFKTLFERMNYDVICEKNVTRDSLLKLLKNKSKDKALEKHDIFVAIIMSHGISDHVITSDNQYVSYDEILKIFNNKDCSNLKDKPKIFIFNSCRSKLHPDDSDDFKSQFKFVDAEDSSTKTNHTFSDILIVFSTLNHYLSVRDEESGTLFAKAFTEAMKANWNEDVCTIVTKANNILNGLVKNNPKNKVEQGQTIEQRKLGHQKNFYFSKLNWQQ